MSTDRDDSDESVRTKATADALRIEELLEDAAVGKFALPTFQRDLLWKKSDKVLLFDSIFRGFPIGTLIFWHRDRWNNAKPLVANAKESPTRFVVDGQQRLTTLFRVLKSVDDDPKHEMVFDLETREFSYRPKGRDGASGERRNVAVPLAVVLDAVALQEWVVDNSVPKELHRQAFRLGDRIRNYRVSTYTIEGDQEQIARDVFARVNSSGKSLKKEEVFRGLFGDSESDLVTLASSLDVDEFGRYSERTLVRVVLALLGEPLESDVATVYRARGDAMKDGVRRALPALARTREFLRDEARCAHLSLVPYELPSLVLAKFFDRFDDPHPRSRTLLRRWFWRDVVDGGLEGNTSNAREHLDAIGDNEHESVQRLLALAGHPRAALKFDAAVIEDGVRLNKASSRTMVALLALRQPRHLVFDEAVSISGLSEGASIRLLNSGWSSEKRRKLGALFIHPPVSDLRAALLHASREALESHCVSEAALLRLRAGDLDGFVDQREQEQLEWISSAWSSLAEPSHNDAPPIEHLVSEPLAEAGE
ncbi:MAG: DUF262 domain-containing protein [Myxococcales bacterium]|nr:DUF262 domain-containing protein [Myxococcales bacterium]